MPATPYPTSIQRTPLTSVVLAIMLALALHLLLLSPAWAAGITVNTTADEFGSGANCSLREAIRAANTDAAFGGCTAGSGADTITLPAGTYTLSLSGPNEDTNATGDLDILSNLTINGAGANTTIIDANGLDRVVDVFNSGLTIFLNDLTIRNGSVSSSDGGGIYNNGSTLTLNRSAVISNTASGNQGGGGLFNLDGVVTINNSLISGNNAVADGGFGSGAGLYNLASAATTTINLNNSTISGNTAGFFGGALFNEAFGGSATVDIRNATISGNNALVSGGGIENTATVNMQNTIMTNNSGNGGSNDCEDNVTGTFTGSNNLIDDNASGPCDALSTAAVTNFSASLASNGGGTSTHALLASSNAIDTGTAGCPDHTGAPLTTDQRGIARPQGPTCDIGAFELQTAGGPIAVTTTADELNSDGDCSLREAIQAANADNAVDLCGAGSGTDTITLPAGTYTLSLAGVNENANATGDLDITASLTINGAGSATVIDANTLDRALHATGTANLTIQDLTVQNGNISGDGGAIYANTALTLTNVSILSSTASNNGGGAFVGGNGVFSGGLFQNNYAGGVSYGGGAHG